MVRARGIIDTILVSNASASARKEAMILRTVVDDLILENSHLSVGERELQSFFYRLQRMLGVRQ